MEKYSKYIGLDVHKEKISVAIADTKDKEVRYYGEISNNEESLKKLVRQLKKDNAKLFFCYEAGPCGYCIHRQLSALEQDCHVVAPSMIPKKAGDRVKTDRRDSMSLARLHRAGELTAVWVPDEAQEALRDLTRAREDMKLLQKQAKQRLLAFLLRHDKSYKGRENKADKNEKSNNWTQAHYRWLETVKFNQAVQQIVFQEYVDSVKAMDIRVEALDGQLAEAAIGSVFWPLIECLMALRGINLLTALTIVAEIGDLKRFSSAPQLMKYLGVVPSEYSSGPTKTRGGITKTGNGHVRRVLVEAAWTYRFPARKTAHLQRRAERAPEKIQEIAWNAQKRLCGRYKKLMDRGKLKVQVTTAIARELAGFIWAIGQIVPQPKVTK
jgi:transposase